MIKRGQESFVRLNFQQPARSLLTRTFGILLLTGSNRNCRAL